MKIKNNELKTVISSINNKENILDLARKLNKTVAQTSRVIGAAIERAEEIGKDNFIEQIEKLNWPVNVNYGYIYMGHSPVTADGPVVYGERYDYLGLKPGDYVLSDGELFRARNKIYALIYKAVPTKQTKYYVCIFAFSGAQKKEYENLEKTDPAAAIEYKKKHLRIIDEEWFSDLDIKLEKPRDFCLSMGCTHFVPTKETRIVYLRGKQLGQPEKRHLLSVNSQV